MKDTDTIGVADGKGQDMGEAQTDTQAVVEEVDALLQDALKHAETYRSHDEVRMSAVMAFNNVNKARQILDKIDEREFVDE